MEGISEKLMVPKFSIHHWAVIRPKCVDLIAICCEAPE